jgi:hypothetical protein
LRVGELMDVADKLFRSAAVHTKRVPISMFMQGLRAQAVELTGRTPPRLI